MPVHIDLGNVSFDLAASHDFSWLVELGEPFAVFAEQDSGNICFGVRSGSDRFFVKYAGAETIDYAGDPADAVDRLKQAEPAYRHLFHPVLTNLIDTVEPPSGFALVTNWVNGEGLHPHEQYPPPYKYEHPDSPFRRFRNLPLAERLRAMDRIVEFHVNAESLGYVAVDLYDGSLVYDFGAGDMYLCDIDFYQPSPFVNRMGRLWGSSRFMAPEEFELGALIDHHTNVFTLGAMGFCIFGSDRSQVHWDAGLPLFDVATRAVSPNRRDRYSSIVQFRNAWTTAARAT